MDPVLRNIIGAHGARLYYNLTNLHAALRMAPLGDRLVDAFNLFVGTRECPAPSPNTPRFGDRRTDRVAQIAEAIWIATKTAWQFLFLTRRVAAFERWWTSTRNRPIRRVSPAVLARTARGASQLP